MPNLTAQAILTTISQCEQTLEATSGNDPTLRALLAELLHQEQVQAFVRQQLSGLPDMVTSLTMQIERLEAELVEARERPAATEAVDEITGHKRPRLHDVNDAVGCLTTASPSAPAAVCHHDGRDFPEPV